MGVGDASLAHCLVGRIPVVDARAAQEARVARRTERIARCAAAALNSVEAAPPSGVARRCWATGSQVEAGIHSARGVAQAPAAGLDWHVGQCDAWDRAVHEGRVARHAHAARRVRLEEVALDAAALVGRGGASKSRGRERQSIPTRLARRSSGGVFEVKKVALNARALVHCCGPGGDGG